MRVEADATTTLVAITTLGVQTFSNPTDQVAHQVTLWGPEKGGTRRGTTLAVFYESEHVTATTVIEWAHGIVTHLRSQGVPATVYLKVKGGEQDG